MELRVLQRLLPFKVHVRSHLCSLIQQTGTQYNIHYNAFSYCASAELLQVLRTSRCVFGILCHYFDIPSIQFLLHGQMYVNRPLCTFGFWLFYLGGGGGFGKESSDRLGNMLIHGLAKTYTRRLITRSYVSVQAGAGKIGQTSRSIATF